MQFVAKVQEKSKGGKKQRGYKQKFVFLPQDSPFEKGEKVKVEVEKDASSKKKIE